MTDIFTLEKRESLVNGFEFSLGYFDLQIRFALKASVIMNITLEDALLQYTALYRRIVRDFFRKNTIKDPRWEQIFSGLSLDIDISNLRDVTYRAYIARELSTRSSGEIHKDLNFGCFGFDYNPASKEVKVHFINMIRGSRSSLSRDFTAERLRELERMFIYIKQTYPDATRVLGGSWLYHLEGYRRLYPKEFIENIIPMPLERMVFRGNSIWGQFQNKYGWTNSERYEDFVRKVDEAQTMDELFAAFPCWVLQPSCDIEIFYKEYGIN